jgi:hypothetical protein
VRNCHAQRPRFRDASSLPIAPPPEGPENSECPENFRSGVGEAVCEVSIGIPENPFNPKQALKKTPRANA